MDLPEVDGGLDRIRAGSELILASLVTPYHVLMFALCAIVVWTAPQTWNFTQRLTAPKAAVCLALLCVSVVLMWTQAMNPFLYSSSEPPR